MCDWICDIIFFLQDIILKIWDILVICWNWFWATFEPSKIIASCAGFFTIRAGWLQWGQKFEVILCVRYQIHRQPQISEMYIYNKKNKTEVITEINVLFGANCILHLHKFKEPLILAPLEMKKVTFEPISIYSINCIPINMGEIFDNYKKSMKIIFTTPYGKVIAKKLRQIPHDTFIGDALRKGAFYYIVHNEYPVNNRILDYKIKYFGEVMINKIVKGYFYVYQDGIVRTDFCAKDFLKIDVEKLDDINDVKKFIQQAKLYKSRYTVTIFERDNHIEKSFGCLDEKHVPVLSKFQYIFVEPIVRMYNNRKLKK